MLHLVNKERICQILACIDHMLRKISFNLPDPLI